MSRELQRQSSAGTVVGMQNTQHTAETLAHAALSIHNGDRRLATRFVVTSVLEEFEELSRTDLLLMLGSLLVVNA